MPLTTEVLESRENGQRVTLPVVFLIVLFTWVASASVTYGIISTRIEWLSQRLDNVERQAAIFVQRPEYDVSQAGITSRLDRIERKIDLLR